MQKLHASLIRLPLQLALWGASGLFVAAHAQPTGSTAASAPAAGVAASKAANNDPVVACERAARELVASKGAPAAEVNFLAAPTVLPGSGGDKQLVLRGGGSYRSAQGVRTFSYNCNVDSATSESVGMVMRDTTPAGSKGKTAQITREPDLTHWSPAVCESAVAAALKKRSLRVSDISFGSATRAVKQTGASTAELRGRGRALLAPGTPYTHFGFQCEFDTRDGRLLGSRLDG
jgi:hypothetical protein